MLHSRQNERFLTLAAKLVTGEDVRVLLEPRAVDPTTVLFDSRTVAIQPQRAGMRDVFVGAAMLTMRDTIRDHITGTEQLTPALRLRAGLQAHRQLMRRAPQLYEHVAGRFRFERPETYPAIQWKSLALCTLDVAAEIGGVKLEANNDIPLLGNHDDFRQLADQLRGGAIATEDYAPLREMPVMTLPLRVSAPSSPGPRLQRLQKDMQRSEMVELKRAYSRCFQTKAEGLLPGTASHMPCRIGSTLSHIRLVNSMLELRQGVLPRAFLPRGQARQPVFDPGRQLVIVAWDAHDLKSGSLQDPAFSWRFLAVLIRTYRELGVDLIVVAFADQIIPLGNNRFVYIHMPSVLRTPDVPDDHAFENRFAALLEQSPQLPGGIPASFLPLALRTVERQLATQQGEYDRWTLNLAARRGMPDRFGFQQAHFHRRTVDAADQVLRNIAQMAATESSKFDCSGCFVPAAIREAAPKKSEISAWL